MRKAVAFLALLVLLGSGIYGWGAGAFWPCEPLGRLWPQGSCTQIFDLPDRQIGDIARLANGNILLATGAPANAGGSLIEVSSNGGTPLSQVDLPAQSVDTGVTTMAISRDESRVALSLSFHEGNRRYGTQVFDRNGALVADIERGLPGYLGFDAQGRLLLHSGGLGQQLPDAADVEAFDLAVPTASTTPPAADTLGLFTRGLNAAISADGTMFARLLDRPANQAVVGLLAGTIGPETPAGLLLATSLRSNCNYSLANIAFSASGKVAAEFDCPERFGQTSSALVAWDLVAGKLLLTLPSIDGFGRLLWLDDTAIIATRHNYANGHDELFRIAIPSAD